MYFHDIYVYVTTYVLELLLLHPTISAKSVSQMYDAEIVAFASTPQIAYKVTAYKVDSAYKVGFCWNQIILGIFIVIIDLILSIYCVAC